jgi:hypothetical protein
MRLPKTVNRPNDGFQEVTRRRGGGRGGGHGRGDKPGRGPPGRGGYGGRGETKEKGDETMENLENERKTDVDSNNDDEMENEDELEEYKDGVEEYEDEEEKEEIVKDQKEIETETNKKTEKGKTFFEKAQEESEAERTGGYSEAKERMRERGDNYVESYTQHTTHIKIEFNVKAGTTFDVRSSMIKTLNVMKKSDPTMAIVSKTMKMYDKYLELPSGEKFTDEITVKEYHPPRAASKITCYVGLKSKVKFNEIKYANAVMDFLKKNQIYLRVDNYNNSPVSIPGFLIELHPSLTRIDNLKEELCDMIKDLPIDNNCEALQDWMEANENIYDSENNAEGNHPVPFFRLTSGKRNFGGVSTNVILVECAKEDALFVKYVVTQIYQNPKFDTRGIFIPSGIHLMVEDPQVYTKLLKRQNHYLNNLSVVTIYG